MMPDGETVWFVKDGVPEFRVPFDDVDGFRGEIARFNRECGEKRCFTQLDGDESRPAWRPDGRSIASLCADCLGVAGSSDHQRTTRSVRLGRHQWRSTQADR
jgi:hypothetical protein